MIEFRVLGPVEVWADGRLMESGYRQQANALAGLLVDCGRPVEVDTLIGRVWGPTPPRGARQSLHSLVTRIRRMLRQASDLDVPPVRLDLRSGCYLLDADPERVDIHRFLRLAALARLPQHPAQHRVTLLREAIGLWHGEPLTGLRGDWARQCRSTWRRQHADLVVAWAHAELAVANPDAVIVPLYELATERPLTEPVAATLMRALYAAGRPAEALEHYEAVRRHLIAKLGTDPSAELQLVHQSILRGGRLTSPDHIAQPPARTCTPDH